MLHVQFLILAAFFFGTVAEIRLPLDDGNILIHAEFIRVQGQGYYHPDLILKLTNETSSSWRAVKILFNIGGFCHGEMRTWLIPVTTSLGWDARYPLVTEYTDTVTSLIDKVDGCKAEIIEANLVLAENAKTQVRIEGTVTDLAGVEKQLQEIQGKRNAEQAARAEEKHVAAEELRAEEEQRRKSSEAQAKKTAAANAARRAQQKKNEAEIDAHLAKDKATEEKKMAEELKKIRAGCTVTYYQTVDKKLKDLTVGEEQLVRFCQALSLYPPR